MSDDLKQEEIWHIRQCLAGNREAFAFLVARYENRLFRFCLHMVGSYEDACDLTQETFVKAYGNLSAYRSEYAFSTWIYRILINLCRNFLAKKRRTVALEEEIAVDAPAMADLERKDLWNQVELALRCLPVAERNVFALATFERMGVSEIAQTLDMPRGTVCWRLFQARKKLQSLVSRNFVESK